MDIEAPCKTPDGPHKTMCLSTLSLVKVPCYIWSPQLNTPSFNTIWANEAATNIFGRLLNQQELDAKAAALSPGTVEFFKSSMNLEYENIVVAGHDHTWHVEAIRALAHVFIQLPENAVFNIHNSRCQILLDGQVKTVVLAQCTPDGESGKAGGSKSPSIHPASMHHQGRIHSYLFSNAGFLLHANEAAANDWKSRGTNLTYGGNFHLSDLLQDQGVPQPEAAIAALTAIFENGQEVHRATFPSVNSEGKRKWIMYEMWHAFNATNSQPAMLINALDMTEQKTMEIELEQAKRELLRRNQSLETRKLKLEADQVGLKSQQQALAEQLQQALALHLHPRTAVDTLTVADKAINLLDGIIQGHVPSLEEALAVRNAMVSAQDLRQPQNLDKQLLQEAGLSNDVGLAMLNLLQGDSHTSAKRLSAMMAGKISTNVHPARSYSVCKADLEIRRVSAGAIAAQGMDEAPMKALVPEAEQLLQEASNCWAFDMFKLAAATSDRPLSALGFFLIKSAGLIDRFGVSEDILARYLRQIEDGYKWNQYHNRIHAASVLQMMHMLIQAGLYGDGVLEDITMFACYMSAIVHDFDHPGVNNDFLIKTKHALALTHNDASPLEAHHISSSFLLAHGRPDLTWSDALSKQDQGIVRATGIELVLATDMKKHFSLISCFQAIQQTPVNPSGKPAEDEVISQGDAVPGQGGRLSSLTSQQKLLIAQVALKCSDLSHLACTPEVHSQWVGKLSEEFFQQGDLEKASGLPISPLMDRSKTAEGMAKSQVGFFEIVALPLFNSYVELMPEAKPMLDNVCANYKQWHALNTQ